MTDAPELRVDIISADSASFDGQVLTHPTPALAWARRLVDQGHDPTMIMAVYSNDELATRISLGVAARFVPAETTIDTPRPDDGAPTTEWSSEAPVDDHARSPEPPVDSAARAGGEEAASSAPSAEPAPEPAPEPDRIHAPQLPPAEAPASPLRSRR